MLKTTSLEKEIKEFLFEQGAIKVGFANAETMAGGPPSADITYKLPEAKSAICFAIPLNRDLIRAYLRKDLPYGRVGYEKNHLETNIRAYRISQRAADFLKEKGYTSKPLVANNKYRTDVPGWAAHMYPELSLRYVAVRSGIASFGWSGNVGIKGFGTAIILGCLITTAELKPTEPLPPEENFCTKCKLCQKSCAFRMFSHDEENSITLGGYTFTYAKRIDYNRCNVVCGGYSGLDKDKKWSTWSPGRYDYPDDSKETLRLLSLANVSSRKRPLNRYDVSTGFTQSATNQVIRFTCGNCQIICFGNPKETQENYRILTNSGCVVQKENGDIVVLPAEEAEKFFEMMSPKHKRAYYKDYKHKKKATTSSN
jgi:epoxyqueuosine reductase QueG